MSHVHPLSAATTAGPEVIGGKAYGLVELHRLGLPVPPAFAVDTAACRAYLRDGRLPGGLAAGIRGLEAATGLRFGDPDRPLTVSVRSGARVSMPGMMNTVLNLGVPATPVDPFTADCRARLLASFAAATDAPLPGDAFAQLSAAVGAVFASWETPRARTYRRLHDIPGDLGTAAVVQVMAHGNRDGRSGAGVAFSRDPVTGAPGAAGEVVFGGQGDDVVGGRLPTRPLSDLAAREPAVRAGLAAVLSTVEAHHRDACHVEFTYESGTLWLLQARAGGYAGRAAARVAADLATAGLLSRREALLRVTPAQLRAAPRLAAAPAGLLTRGVGASPGVATGRVAVTADAAARMAAAGPVVLVRPETSPLDLHGLAAAAGVVTTRGGPTSHAAVVARGLGRPAVVSARGLTVEPAGLRLGDRTLPEGTLLTIDGTGGEVVLGAAPTVPDAPDPAGERLLAWADEVTGGDPARPAADRLADARRALRA